MKILVPTKRVPDPDQEIRIREDSSGIDILRYLQGTDVICPEAG